MSDGGGGTQCCANLEEGDVLFFQLIVVFDLHGDGLVSVNVAKLNVCSVLHEEATKKPGGSQTGTGTDPHHAVESRLAGKTVLEVCDEAITISAGLGVGPCECV